MEMLREMKEKLESFESPVGVTNSQKMINGFIENVIKGSLKLMDTLLE